MEYQYRDFLKAVGGHARVSASQHTSPKFSMEEGTGNDSGHSPVPMVHDLMKTAAMRELGLENPRSADEDDPVNSVMDTEITRIDSVDFARQANVKEDNSNALRGYYATGIG
nr:hypothetical protein CFP56_47139 [Quercus suber]